MVTAPIFFSGAVNNSGTTTGAFMTGDLLLTLSLKRVKPEVFYINLFGWGKLPPGSNSRLESVGSFHHPLKVGLLPRGYIREGEYCSPFSSIPGCVQVGIGIGIAIGIVFFTRTKAIFLITWFTKYYKLLLRINCNYNPCFSTTTSNNN